jgi:protein TonB
MQRVDFPISEWRSEWQAAGWRMEVSAYALCLLVALLLHAGLLIIWPFQQPVMPMAAASTLDVFAVAPPVAAASVEQTKAPEKPAQTKAESAQTAPIHRRVERSERRRPPKPINTPTPSNTPTPMSTATVAPASTPAATAVATNAALTTPRASASVIPAEPVLVKKPKFLQSPNYPEYPAIARRRGQQGTVWLEILLSEKGQQLRLSIARSSGFVALDEAAKVAVARWQLAPYQMNGVAVRSRVQVPVEFVIR